jgi:uncharacterized protein
MPLSMYQASTPVFTRILTNLSAILGKAQAHCEARNIDPLVLTSARLYPDMFALARQVQIACDGAKGAVARLAGVEIPKHDDTEKTFAELQARIAKTVEFMATVKPAQIDGTEARDIVVKMRAGDVAFKGQPYLLGFALPNFYFHVATAYNILRHNGVEIGKKDFLGPQPTT